MAPAATSFLQVSGVAATRRSPGADSRAIPIVTGMPGSRILSPAIVANRPGWRDCHAAPRERGSVDRRLDRLRRFVEVLPELLHGLVERRVHRAHDRLAAADQYRELFRRYHHLAHAAAVDDQQARGERRSEEHTSELQSRENL